ncbi:hypothetical protein [Amnibacterium endophyticum]|uniref:Sensor domain-containing protein n=1 Tax=Amnibacterium endophyticum TaxID=2109337 RepID=A0ABW4LFU0_9MICO
MDETTDALPPAFTSALANEQFILQSVSGATISESGSRSALYLSSLSSGLVAIGFASAARGAFAPLAFTVLPTVFLLGCFTAVRLVDTSVENLVALRRAQRIRTHWARLHPTGSWFFEADAPGTGQRGSVYGFWSLLFTMASLIVLVNGVLGGAIAALVVAVALHGPAAVAVGIGIVVGLASVASGLTYEHRRIDPFIRSSTRQDGPPQSSGETEQ